jgi:hypothetical protein
MFSKKSLQWCAFILVGLGLIGMSAEVLIVFHTLGWPIWLGAGLGLCGGLALIFFAEKREGPMRAIRQARQSMQFPQMWKIKFDTKTPKGVSVPIVVKRVDGVRFVVEICTELSVSWRSVQNGAGKAGKSLLVGPQGKPIKRDPVEGLMKISHAAGAAPVLWLPFGETHKNLRHAESNLMIVMGSASDLKHALQGAEIVPIRPGDEPQKTDSNAPDAPASPEASPPASAPASTAVSA